MNTKQLTNQSKFLSLVLRHEPAKFGVVLDEAGWTDIDHLLSACAKHGQRISREELDAVVNTNDKKRFAFSEDGVRIRANQGHSTPVALDHPAAVPPAELYHGTFADAVESILREGLHRGARHHVHLSENRTTASAVGQRRGSPVILTVLAAAMHADGHAFFLTPNGVWLTDQVPAKYITGV